MASPPADHDPPDRTRTAPPDARRARLPAEVDLAPGTRLGRYIVGARLGGGGMGVVYAAEDPELGRTIALKLVRADHAGGLAAEERFEREARAMAQLSHPHVVAVFDVGRVDGRMFLTMEHLSGGTLRAWLARRPSWSEVCARMLEAARGLAAAHAKGIVHRDFKPENVLLDERGHARVTDFGLARVAGETVLGATAPVPTELEALTLTGTVVGTPAYMAPEQRRGEAADARSDQYSLCLTWVEALCGTRPASPRTAPVPAPRALAAILRRGLAEEPADRWPSLDALIAASERVLRRRRLAPAGVVLAGVTGVVAIAVAARPGSTTITAPAPAPLTPAPRAPAAPPNEPPGLEPVSIARKKPGDEPWVMVLDPTGTTALYWVTDRARGDRAWTEALDGGRRTELVLPEGFAITPGYGLLRGGPRGERVFSNLALPDGREALWRLGRSGVAPRQFRPPGEPFLMCVSNDGARIAVIDDTTLEILDTESARSVHRRAISDAADCAWSWDGRLAVLRVVDGGVVIELERPGEPPVALHAPDLAGTPRAVEWGPTTDTLLVGHDLEVPPRAFVTELDVTGASPPRARLVFDGTRVQNLQLTAAGLFVSTVQHVRRIEVAALHDGALGPLVPIVTRSSADADLAGWEDASTLLFGLRRGSESRSARYRIDGTLDVAATHDWEVPAGVTGGETIFARRAVRSGDTSPLRLEAAEPGCGIFGRAGERTRAIAPAPCGDPSPWLRCAGVAPPCLLVEPRGLERAFAPFDPATGRREAPLLVRDRQHEPNVALAPDGRFVLAQRSPALELFDRAGKLARTITLPKIDAYDAGWMPDGRTLVVTTLGFPFQILRVTPDGRHEPLHRSEHTLYGSPRVSPDGRHLAVTAADVVPEFTLYPGLGPR